MDRLVEDPKKVREVLHALLDNTTDNIVYLTTDYKVKAFNNVAFETLRKYRSREIKIGDDYRDFVTRENEEFIYSLFKAALNGLPQIVEYELIRVDSGSIWFEYKVNPIYESEQIVGITITAKNINAQKMAYQELQQKLGILDAVFNSTTDGLLLLDFDYTVVKVNDTFISLLQGLSGHELKVNENFLNIIFTEKNKSLFIQLAEKAKLGEQVELEYFTKSSLSSRWLFYKISPVYNEKRFVIGILMTVNDIDKQKKHKIELQKSEEKFRKIVHSAAHPIMIVDLSMKIMLVNPETELVFGYSEDELLEKSISLLIPERFQKNHKQHQAEYLKNPQHIRMGQSRLTPAKHKSGEEIIIEASLSSFTLNNEPHVLVILQDVTQRIESDKKIASQLEQLKKIAWEQAHEVRRPVTNILGLINLLSDDNTIETNRQALLYIRESAEQLDFIIHKIVDYTKENPL